MVRRLQRGPLMLMPSVSRYMTLKPYTIEKRGTFAQARRIMRDHAIRHLPVVDGGRLCGVVSERDISMFVAGGADPYLAEIDAAMVERPFIVTSDTSLDEVAAIMGEQKYGSVVVVGRDGIEGILTSTDICRALASVLRTVVGD